MMRMMPSLLAQHRTSCNITTFALQHTRTAHTWSRRRKTRAKPTVAELMTKGLLKTAEELQHAQLGAGSSSISPKMSRKRRAQQLKPPVSAATAQKTKLQPIGYRQWVAGMHLDESNTVTDSSIILMDCSWRIVSILQIVRYSEP